MSDQTREQRLQNMVSLTCAAPDNAIVAEPGTEEHSEPWEPWAAPVMVLAGLASGADGLMPWLYLACHCGWWLGYGTQYDPAKFTEVAAVHGEHCPLKPAAAKS